MFRWPNAATRAPQHQKLEQEMRFGVKFGLLVGPKKEPKCDPKLCLAFSWRKVTLWAQNRVPFWSLESPKKDIKNVSADVDCGR